MDFVMVGLGGFCGALLRYIISIVLPFDTGFPLATCIVNLVGCFLLAYIMIRITDQMKFASHMKLLLGTGLIGSFTTFSTFSVEMVELMNDGAYAIAIGYTLVSVIGGIALAFLGARLASKRIENI